MPYHQAIIWAFAPDVLLLVLAQLVSLHGESASWLSRKASPPAISTGSVFVQPEDFASCGLYILLRQRLLAVSANAYRLSSRHNCQGRGRASFMCL